MTTYYLSLRQGTDQANEASVAEATAGPTADVIVEIGGGNVPAANISRKWLLQALAAITNWIETDDPDNPAKSGSGTLPLTR